MPEFPQWPAWYYSQAGGARIFEQAEDVPGGWMPTPAAFPDQQPTRKSKAKSAADAAEAPPTEENS